MEDARVICSSSVPINGDDECSEQKSDLGGNGKVNFVSGFGGKGRDGRKWEKMGEADGNRRNGKVNTIQYFIF